MKSNSLFSKSIITILVPVVIVCIAILLATNFAITSFFEIQSYQLVEAELNRINDMNIKINSNIENIKLLLSGNIRPTNSARITYLIKTDEGFNLHGVTSRLVGGELKALVEDHQLKNQGKFSYEESEYYYMVRKAENELIQQRLGDKEIDGEIYYLAYISESYSKMLSNNVMTVVAIGLFAFILIIGTVVFFVFRKIGQRLHSLENGVHQIGEGRFDVTLAKSPSDEIGRLGSAVENMGKQLYLAQTEQAEEFQAISHELKTPIMVMGGFIDALKRGQYPSGTLEGTISILEDELDKLSGLVGGLLMLSKIQYMSKNNIKMEKLAINPMIHQIFKRLNVDKPQIILSVEGDCEVTGDYKSWVRIFENILTNQLRHSHSTIHVRLGKEINIANDGDHINEDELVRINEPFYHGEHGGTGLGLSIIKNTLKLYDMVLIVENTSDGVGYRIVDNKR